MPVDDKFFEKVNVAQLSWYNMQLSLDEKEQFELYRDLVEHNAMFTNPEGVQRIRENRENTIAVPDEQFKQTVKDLFGRDLPEELGEDKDINEILDKNSKKEDNISQYLSMELDDIKFIPQ